MDDMANYKIVQLCNELGETGKIDTMIENLVKKVLPTIVH